MNLAEITQKVASAKRAADASKKSAQEAKAHFKRARKSHKEAKAAAKTAKRHLKELKKLLDAAKVTPARTKPLAKPHKVKSVRKAVADSQLPSEPILSDVSTLVAETPPVDTTSSSDEV